MVAVEIIAKVVRSIVTSGVGGCVTLTPAVQEGRWCFEVNINTPSTRKGA